MESSIAANIHYDMDTLLRFICTHSLHDTHVSQAIIAKSFDSFPENVKTFAFLLEFSPEQKNFSGINFTSIKSELQESSIKSLSEFIDYFRKENIQHESFPLVYDFFLANPFTYFVYFLRNTVISQYSNSDLSVNPKVIEFFVWLIENKKDQLLFSRIVYFIRHWQTITIFDSKNVKDLLSILSYAKDKKIYPSFN